MVNDTSAEEKLSSDASFEEVLARLEQVVERLERGDLPLEDSLAMFEEGVRLSRLGARRLDAAERRVEILLSYGNGVETRALEESKEGGVM